MSSIAERLKAAQAKYDVAAIKKKATSPYRVDIPDGTYLCKPSTATVTLEGATGKEKPVWKIAFIVNEGTEHDGKQLNWRQFLDTETGLEIAYRTCAQLGFDVAEEGFTLEDNLEEICDLLMNWEPEIKVQVKTNKDKDDPTIEYQNFNVRGQATWPEDMDEDDAAATSKKAKAEPAAAATSKKSVAQVVSPEEVPATKRGRGRPRKAAEQAVAAAAPADEDEDETPPPTEDVTEDEDEDEDEDEVDMVVGSTITGTFKEETLKGKVLEILEDESKVRVDVGGGRVVKIKFDNITEVK